MQTKKITKVKGEWWKETVRKFKRDWQLHLLIWLPMIYVIIFQYIPMYGVQMAFRDYSIGDSFGESTWVGLQWFEQFMSSPNFGKYLWNTISLSLYTLVVGFPLPIIYALLLNTVTKEKFKKTVQTISYMPHFISTVTFIGIIQMIFSPVGGLYGSVYRLLGGVGIPKGFVELAGTFRHLYVWSGVWQELGWNSIIYISALSGVSAELHEAAQIDGATRWQRMWHIDVPSIMPTIAILLIMRCGSIISVGFEKAFLLQTTLNRDVSEILSIHVWRTAFGGSLEFSYSSAVGLWNLVINITLLFVVNTITKKLTEDEVSLF